MGRLDVAGGFMNVQTHIGRADAYHELYSSARAIAENRDYRARGEQCGERSPTDASRSDV
jgi:hypothetical protein